MKINILIGEFMKNSYLLSVILALAILTLPSATASSSKRENSGELPGTAKKKRATSAKISFPRQQMIESTIEIFFPQNTTPFKPNEKEQYHQTLVEHTYTFTDQQCFEALKHIKRFEKNRRFFESAQVEFKLFWKYYFENEGIKKRSPQVKINLLRSFGYGIYPGGDDKYFRTEDAYKDHFETRPRFIQCLEDNKEQIGNIQDFIDEITPYISEEVTIWNSGAFWVLIDDIEFAVDLGSTYNFTPLKKLWHIYANEEDYFSKINNYLSRIKIKDRFSSAGNFGRMLDLELPIFKAASKQESLKDQSFENVLEWCELFPKMFRESKKTIQLYQTEIPEKDRKRFFQLFNTMRLNEVNGKIISKIITGDIQLHNIFKLKKLVSLKPAICKRVLKIMTLSLHQFAPAPNARFLWLNSDGAFETLEWLTELGLSSINGGEQCYRYYVALLKQLNGYQGAKLQIEALNLSNTYISKYCQTTDFEKLHLLHVCIARLKTIPTPQWNELFLRADKVIKAFPNMNHETKVVLLHSGLLYENTIDEAITHTKNIIEKIPEISKCVYYLLINVNRVPSEYRVAISNKALQHFSYLKLGMAYVISWIKGVNPEQIDVLMELIKTIPEIETFKGGQIGFTLFLTNAIPERNRKDYCAKISKIAKKLQYALSNIQLCSTLVIPANQHLEMIDIIDHSLDVFNPIFLQSVFKDIRKTINFLFSQSPKLKAKAVSHWTTVLKAPEKQKKSYIKNLCQLIIHNSEAIGLDDQHPLYLQAIEIFTTFQDLSNQKNPYAVFKKLKQQAEVKVDCPIKFTPTHCNNKIYTVNCRFFQELNQYKILGSDLPAYDKDDLKNMVDSFEERLSSAADDKKEAIYQAITDETRAMTQNISDSERDTRLDYEVIKEGSLGSPYLHNILARNFAAKDEVPQTDAKFICIVSWIKGKSTARKQGQILSEQECALLKTLASIQLCSNGKEDGIYGFYNHLPAHAKLKFNDSEDATHPETAKARELLLPWIYMAIGDLFYGDNQFIRSYLHIPANQPIVQASHQSLLLRNLIGPDVGLPHKLKLDLHTKVLYETLLEVLYQKPKSNVVMRYYDFFMPYLLQSLAAKINADNSNNDCHAFKVLNPFLGDKLKGDEKWQCDVNGKNMKITNQAVVESLVKLGSLK